MYPLPSQHIHLVTSSDKHSLLHTYFVLPGILNHPVCLITNRKQSLFRRSRDLFQISNANFGWILSICFSLSTRCWRKPTKSRVVYFSSIERLQSLYALDCYRYLTCYISVLDVVYNKHGEEEESYQFGCWTVCVLVDPVEWNSFDRADEKREEKQKNRLAIISRSSSSRHPSRPPPPPEAGGSLKICSTTLPTN